MILTKLLVFGAVGLLIEVFFTGFHSVIIARNWRATAQTYLWMLPIYGGGGLLLEWIHARFQGFAFVAIAVPLIYALELISGLALRLIIGRVPWDYGTTKWGIAGLVRLDYLPFWLVVALSFDTLCEHLSRAVAAAASVL